MKWLYDWSEAAKRPGRSLAVLFASGFVGAATYAYFEMTDENPLAAVSAGTLSGLVFALLGVHCIRQARDPQRAAAMAQRARSQLAVSAFVLLVAFAIGYAAHSVQLFVILLLASYAVSVGLGAWRKRHR